MRAIIRERDVDRSRISPQFPQEEGRDPGLLEWAEGTDVEFAADQRTATSKMP